MIKTRVRQSASTSKSTTKYKDSLFRALFKDEQRAKELCGAISGIEFPKDAHVQLCTLKDSILNRYNDIGVAIGNRLFVLHEENSINPNIPYRLLESSLYSYGKWFVDRKMLYGEELVEIPFPEFYVLYNGKKKLEETTLKLSSAFKMKDRKVMIELEVDVIDINYERNHTVLEKSPTLKGYSYLIATIRKFIDAGDSRDVAVAKAVRKCISEGILADFLSENNFEEVCDMLDFEYNLEDELAVRGEQREKKGRIEGMISVYFTEMSLNAQQIAEKLGIKEKEVSETLDRLQLV